AYNSVIPAKIVATTRYFPSVDGDVVIADRRSFLTVANSLEPGVATASETWLQHPPSRTLPLAVDSQRAQTSELTGDPLARGSIALLGITALVALALAAVGLLLTVIGDLRAEAGGPPDPPGPGCRAA